MQTLNFHERFIDVIESGEKKLTLRRHNKNIKFGDTVELMSGKRTLKQVIIKRVCSVKVLDYRMELDGCFLHPSLTSRDQPDPTDEEFAKAGGFPSFFDMAEWLECNYGRPYYGLPFEGVAIQWDNIIPQPQFVQDGNGQVIGVSR